MEKITPYEPTHPGEILKEELEYRNISQRKLALKLGVSYTMLNEIMNGKRPVSADFALLMEAALGVSADMLLSMQTTYNLQKVRRSKK